MEDKKPLELPEGLSFTPNPNGYPQVHLAEGASEAIAFLAEFLNGDGKHWLCEDYLGRSREGRPESPDGQRIFSNGERHRGGDWASVVER